MIKSELQSNDRIVTDITNMIKQFYLSDSYEMMIMGIFQETCSMEMVCICHERESIFYQEIL